MPKVLKRNTGQKNIFYKSPGFLPESSANQGCGTVAAITHYVAGYTLTG